MTAARNSKFDLSTLPKAPDFSFELTLWNSGVQFIAGIDEAGRGALAGPVAAAAVIFPPDPGLEARLRGVNDSKKLTKNGRDEWAQRIPGMALANAVGLASNTEIDEIGIVPATRLAVERALQGLYFSPQHLLVDFLKLPDCALPQTALIKGDARSLSIAAASIMAKTARDEMLRLLDLEYPGYGFAQHKGYGTRAHQQAIQELGLTASHRQSFHLKHHHNTVE